MNGTLGHFRLAHGDGRDGQAQRLLARAGRGDRIRFSHLILLRVGVANAGTDGAGVWTARL